MDYDPGNIRKHEIQPGEFVSVYGECGSVRGSLDSYVPVDIANVSKLFRESAPKECLSSSSDFLRLRDDKDFLKALGMIYENKDGSIDLTLASLLFVGNESDIRRFVPCSELAFIAYDKSGKEYAEERYCAGLLSMIS